LLPGYEGSSAISISWDVKISKENDTNFSIKGEKTVLSLVYHLLDLKVCQITGYKKQILFKLLNQ
jgi:hypothetical protein